MINDELDSKSVLGEDGLMAKANPQFSPRPSQVAMAQAIEEAIAQQGNLLVEAGTGTGKTFAYLIPAILSGKKVVISTGTKNLQDQLFFKDLPVVKQLLKSSVKSNLLKGRSNHLCPYRLNNHAQSQLYGSKKLIAELQEVMEWSAFTKKGDIAELTQISEDSAIWGDVTSNNDNCLGGECEFIDKCFVLEARKKALQANVVVINHHLFFADVLLKEQGVGELLPQADIVIFDEAHQLIDVATQFYSERISSRQVMQLINDLSGELVKLSMKPQQLLTALERLESAIQAMRQGFDGVGNRAFWPKGGSKLLDNACSKVVDDLELVERFLESISSKSQGLELCYERCVKLATQFKRLTKSRHDADYIHWYETFSKSFIIYLTPKSVASQFGAMIEENKKAWIFTSATLTSNNNFDYFSSQLGLTAAKQLQLDSPFNFKEQALLYLPRGLPDTSSEKYVDQLTAAMLPVLKASEGRAFFLFTSYAAMHKAREALKETEFKLLVQGEKSKRVLIEEFIDSEHAVLLGTASFWEGVDIPGKDLSCVIIDKLPFASPGDPIVQARIESQRTQGVDPFSNYQVPNAAISLKQGVGRLIRGLNDKGVLVIGDPRLTARHYGQVFFNSLPAMSVTRELAKVEAFLEEL